MRSPSNLEAVDGTHPGQGQPDEEHDLEAPATSSARDKICEMGENDQRNPMGLISGGVAGVQMADVSVDTETGIVKMNRSWPCRIAA